MRLYLHKKMDDRIISTAVLTLSRQQEEFLARYRTHEAQKAYFESYGLGVTPFFRGGGVSHGVIPPAPEPEFPYDYEVEYLELVGGMSYIDTGYMPEEQSEIEIYIKFLYYSSSNNSSRVLSSSAIDVVNSNQYCLVRVDSGGQVVMSCFVGSSVSTVDNVVKANEIVEVYMSQSSKSYKINTEGIDYTGVFTDNPSYRKPIRNIVLFSDMSNRMFYGKIFGCTIKNYGQLVRDIIPVVKNGIACMYDKVSGEILDILGTGSFNAGPQF